MPTLYAIVMLIAGIGVAVSVLGLAGNTTDAAQIGLLTTLGISGAIIFGTAMVAAAIAGKK